MPSVRRASVNPLAKPRAEAIRFCPTIIDTKTPTAYSDCRPGADPVAFQYSKAMMQNGAKKGHCGNWVNIVQKLGFVVDV